VSFVTAPFLSEAADLRALGAGGAALASGVCGTPSATAFGFLEEVLFDCMKPF
jgi:hypothetical protein